VSADRPAVFESVHRKASTLRYHRHGTPFATIVLEGSYTEVGDGRPGVHRAGSIVLHRAAEEHADYFTSAARCLNVELDDAIEHAASQTGAFAAPLRRAVDDVVRAFNAGAPSAAMERAARKLHAALARGAIEPPALPAWLAATIERFGWASDQPIGAAAKLAGVHPTHFSREFHRRVGMTPNAFRQRARVRRASDLLLATSAGLSAVAQECGFNDQSHFTRAFGAALGLSPAAYRRTFSR